LLLYYITDRSQFPGTEFDRRSALLLKIAEAADAGVDYIQLREKDLSTRELESLAQDAARLVRAANATPDRRRPYTRLLINSRTDVALATGADGVHLRSTDISPATVRDVLATCAEKKLSFSVAISCHSIQEVRVAESAGASFAVFAPVFEKLGAPKVQITGLQTLTEALRSKIPLLALGGITLENAAECVHAGAAGVAGIRLFQNHRIKDVVAGLDR
jgi:thiamine-phosphate pyrophosphorylase